jgi:predicted nucleotidyltransferase
MNLCVTPTIERLLSMRKIRMRLSSSEKAWLKAYREELAAKYANCVKEVIVFGSKARGEAGPDSDFDVLLIVTNGASARKRDLRRVGYLLAAATDVVPSIMAYTEQEWDARKQSCSPFRANVERDGVRVL